MVRLLKYALAYTAALYVSVVGSFSIVLNYVKWQTNAESTASVDSLRWALPELLIAGVIFYVLHRLIWRISMPRSIVGKMSIYFLFWCVLFYIFGPGEIISSIFYGFSFTVILYLAGWLMAKVNLFLSKYRVSVKISEQIKWVGVGWFLYGAGSLLMRVFGFEPFEYVFLDVVNMILGLGLYFRINILIKIGRVYLWVLLMAINSFPFGMRADFGIDPQLVATEYFIPLFEIVLLLWFFRRICVINELARDKNDPTAEPIYGLGEQIAIKSPFIWWPIIISLTSGVWVNLLPR